MSSRDNDPFGYDNKNTSLNHHANRAGLIVTLTALTVAAVAAAATSDNHKKSKSKAPAIAQSLPTLDSGGQEGQELVARLKANKPVSHLQGILAVSDASQPPVVVLNPYVLPGPGITHPQPGAENLSNDYAYFALVATKDPTTGKITLKPDEVLAGEEGPVGSLNRYVATNITAEFQSDSTPIEQSKVASVSTTLVHTPNKYVFNPADETTIRLLGHYTYSITGNEVLAAGNTSHTLAADQPVGVLFETHRVQ